MPRVLGVVAAVAMTVLWLGVNIFPAITNDSLAYLSHANELLGRGLVQLGYRQFGYPAFAAAARGFGDAIGGNPVLWIALTQRALFALAAVYMAWLWRWWSLPVLLLLAAPTFVVYSNQILTEGLGIPTAILLAAATTHAVAVVQGRPQARGISLDSVRGRRAFMVLVGVVAFLAFVAVSVRYTYATLGIAPAAVAFAAWQYRRSALKPALIGLAVYTAAVALLTVGISVENRAEYGRFTPSTRTARTEYWSAWTLVFNVHKENRGNERLAEFEEEGPYGFIHPVDKIDDLDRTDAMFEQRRAELLAAAGMDFGGEQRDAFVGALSGGRLDDFRHIVRKHADTGLRGVRDQIYRASHARAAGRPALDERFNDGVPMTAVLTDGVVPDPPFPYFVTLLRPLLVFSLILSLVGLARRATRAVALATAAPPLAMALAAAMTLADNVRFLMITSVWAVAMSGPLLRLLWGEFAPRRPASTAPAEQS